MTGAGAAAAETRQSLLSLYRPDLSRALATMGAPSYRFAQVYEHLVRRPLNPFADATALPAAVREACSKFGVTTLTVADSLTSADGATKLLLSARDGVATESVIMRYRERVTVCISSQVGCPVGCLFCATGAMGFRRNLSTAEIVDQVLTASVIAGREGRRISNVVYMGMGEPLLNLRPVLESIRVLTDPYGFGLAHRALSVSTIGVPSAILSLAHAEPQVNLAVSLHAADERTRGLLVPGSSRYALSKVLEAAWEHFELTHRKLLVEYVLLAGINDSVADARRLAALLRGHVVAVNLLAWNPVPRIAGRRPQLRIEVPRREGRVARRRSESPRREGEVARPESEARADIDPLPLFRPSSPAAIAAFRQALLSARIEAVVRQSKGTGIRAACGQLAWQGDSYEKKKVCNEERAGPEETTQE